MPNKLKLVEKIIDKCDRNSINQRDKWGKSALDYAIANKYKEIENILIESGAQPPAKRPRKSKGNN